MTDDDEEVDEVDAADVRDETASSAQLPPPAAKEEAPAARQGAKEKKKKKPKKTRDEVVCGLIGPASASITCTAPKVARCSCETIIGLWAKASCACVKQKKKKPQAEKPFTNVVVRVTNDWTRDVTPYFLHGGTVLHCENLQRLEPLRIGATKDFVVPAREHGWLSFHEEPSDRCSSATEKYGIRIAPAHAPSPVLHSIN